MVRRSARPRRTCCLSLRALSQVRERRQRIGVSMRAVRYTLEQKRTKTYTPSVHLPSSQAPTPTAVCCSGHLHPTSQAATQPDLTDLRPVSAIPIPTASFRVTSSLPNSYRAPLSGPPT
ncbi:hypothetical protein C8Q78DRAFT_562703 [Trametes maxima]|nr:hypothetical protein C8Q78DRAFT_562703 [Trametes maxima]